MYGTVTQRDADYLIWLLRHTTYRIFYCLWRHKLCKYTKVQNMGQIFYYSYIFALIIRHANSISTSMFHAVQRNEYLRRKQYHSRFVFLPALPGIKMAFLDHVTSMLDHLCPALLCRIFRKRNDTRKKNYLTRNAFNP